MSQSFQVSILNFMVYEYLLNIAPVEIRMRNEAVNGWLVKCLVRIPN